LVYGRDFFDDDKFYTNINRRRFTQLCLNFEDYPRKLMTKYSSYLAMDDVLQAAVLNAQQNRERGRGRR